jgi:hypothetical protein
MNHRSQIPFIKEKAFRTAWFSYIRLVELATDMRCLHCGDVPKVTIWDGVTLSFNRKNILSTLKPPTVVDEQSEVKHGTKAQQGLQLISDKPLRKLIHTILSGKPLCLPRLPREADGPLPMPCSEMKEMMDRVELVPNVVARLSKIDKHLGALFDRYFGFEYLFSKGSSPAAYKELFLQVWF